MGLGPAELGVIAVIVVLLFGPKQIPKMGKALGETLREFRGIGKELTSAQDAAEDAAHAVEREVRQATVPRRRSQNDTDA